MCYILFTVPFTIVFWQTIYKYNTQFNYKVQLQSSTTTSMFFYCKVESSNVPLFTFIWVIPCQLIQNSELFPVHFMDFLKENSCKKKLLLNSWDLAKSCCTCTFPAPNEKQAQQVFNKRTRTLKSTQNKYLVLQPEKKKSYYD